jgi:REP element-mobilizing transposase RayT
MDNLKRQFQKDLRSLIAGELKKTQEEKLKQEFPSFLKKCRRKEALVCKRKFIRVDGKLVRDNTPCNIPTPPSMLEQMMINCETLERRSIKMFLDEHICKDAKGRISTISIKSALISYLAEHLNISKIVLKSTINSTKRDNTILKVVNRRLITHIEKWQAKSSLESDGPNTVYEGVSWIKDAPQVDEEEFKKNGDTIKFLDPLEEEIREDIEKAKEEEFIF